MKKTVFLLVGLMVSMSQLLYSQSNKNNNSTDSSRFTNNVKISGMIQPQFQIVESNGASTISGGNFEPNTNSRIIIRRARLKASFNSKYSEYVFQISGTEKGLKIDEVYLVLSEPILNTFKLTAGIFDRPLGYEIGYSSSKIESAERARVMKALCPDEKDLGAMLTIQAPESSRLHFISLDAGIFNGTGTSNRDFDNRKDIIAHLHMNRTAFSGFINYGIGLSLQSGGFDNQRNEHYVWNHGFQKELNDTLQKAVRSFKGIDAQCSMNWTLGKTELRGEYLFGIQSSTGSSNKTPSEAPKAAAYSRDFNGGYLMFLHTFNNNIIQLAAKYDWYDPNTKITSNQIGLLSNTGVSDINFTTLGFGLNYFFNENLKLLVWYDIIENESTQITDYNFDLKDDLFTLRIQYKF
jgi:hypothetical protein